MKKIASAVIIYDPIKQVILGVHPTGRKWKDEDGKPERGVFSLPKGLVDENEHPVEAAIREIKEECNIDLDIKKLHYLKKYNYTKHKDLELFFYPIKTGPNEGELNIEKCKCTSYFNKEGKKYPEVNGYSFINPWTEEMKWFFPAQQRIINKVMLDFPKYFE
jgi:8-oxo-dGTP pyrophosphatase MutT (NUDIX family)